jgi:hypothetical protein
VRRILISLSVICGLVGCEGSIIPSAASPTILVDPGVPALSPPPRLPPPAEELPAYSPGPFRPRLLLAAQYRNAILSLLGPEAAAAVTAPSDVAVNGLSSIGASQVALSTTAIAQYETNAFAAAKAGLAARAGSIIPCTPTGASDSACLKATVEKLSSAAFRRAVTAEEISRWVAIGTSAATAYASFQGGIEFVIAGLLQSPAFLYLDETGVVDQADATRRVLTAREFANRMSFFIVEAPPDPELLEAAASGALDTPEGVRAQAKRLVELPAAREAVLHFFDEALDLADLEDVAKDSQVFPTFTKVLTASMKEETHRLLAWLSVDGEEDFRNFFDTTTTFVDAQLAGHYGLQAPTSGWQKVVLPDTQLRRGFLMQGSFLSRQSHPARNSPTYRGKFVRERLLCEQISAPPANVSTDLPAAPPGSHRTLRDTISLHMQDPVCAGCHALMDPIGFAFENFDAIGRHRTADDTLPVDASGTLDGQATFTDAKGLVAHLKDDPRPMLCLTRVLFRQATGHVDDISEARPLYAARDAFAASGYRFKTLVVEVVASEAFRKGRLEVSP